MLLCIVCSLPRVYVINKEICMRTVCQDDEYRKGETLCMYNEADVGVETTLYQKYLLQPNCAESCLDGRGVLRGHLIGDAVTITIATPKVGQTRPDGCQDGNVTTGEDGAPGVTENHGVSTDISGHNTMKP